MAKLAGLGATLFAILALAGCADPLTTGVVGASTVNRPEFIPGLPKGYQCPLVPNGFDPAGSIYRLDKSDTYYRVKDFSSDPTVKSMSGYKKDVLISNYVLSDQQTASAGLSFEILKNALPGLSANASADFNKEISVDITVEDMVGEVIDDTVADYIVNWFKTNIEPKPGNKYFLVRETVKAGSVSYRLKHKDLAKFGGKAQLEKLAEGASNVTVNDNNGMFEIKQKFSPDRIPVCIKSAEIVVDATKATQPTAAASVSLKSADDTKVPLIKRVGQK
jgi:hypothetical protein